MRHLIILILLITSSFQLIAQHHEYHPDPDTSIHRRLEEWKDLKFGLLMHWGPYSQWGIVESWSICPEDLSWATGGRKPGISESYFDYVKRYEALQYTFNPTKFNPEKWASAAKVAGMKYMVFTTKHHDGFSMFDTKLTDYKITGQETPFSSHPRSNVTKEVFDAFRKENFWIGAYFSKPDWHSDYYWWRKFPPSDRNCNYSVTKHPEQWQKFVDFTHGQINELVSDYGKVDILWLDGGWVRKTSDGEVKKYLADESEGSRWARNPQNQDINMSKIVKDARKKQPKLIVVDRAVTGEHQNCMTMANSWSYVPNDKYKPTNEIIEKLVDIVSKGGNYLLNIGPSPEGEFDSVAYSRLHEIGSWMKTNGEAIYSTRTYDTFKEGDGIRFTKSKDGKTKYIFLFDFPDKAITLTKVSAGKTSRIQLLGSSAKIKWAQKGPNLEINLPAQLMSVSDHVWVLKIVD